MPKSSFVDFKAVKAVITMEQVLKHYGLTDKFKRNGESLSGPCPIHEGTNPTQFRINTIKNIWNCFSKCGHGGNILDFISEFHEELKVFFANSAKLATHLVEAAQTLKDKETLIASHQQTIQKVREEMSQTHKLYLEGNITSKGFGEFYKPAEERLNQLLAELPKLQAEIDLIKVNRISTEDVMAEANTLYDKWPSLPVDDRRKIAETVCEKIVIGDGEIDITLSHLPSSEELCKNQTSLWAAANSRSFARWTSRRRSCSSSRWPT